ncbi:MerR family transcriptional regulator [Deinococcus peraridilitoris]|uniref:HTH merR-type domain-containing protein n=1 Tax=Deinococcus peraridilitoris (strain DSM 19664 / LMG 22246 / CIP 109416 / KR-200) TaxID=937777 RepID=L0A1T3_DEIPD|nr:MerR family transcriptional regulator [Deinococcus peraridilitoris]AFZ67414.1 hypothetical protein Deipe_1906 [Deinococcus peraridilitoris DSM 19664]
MPSPLEPYREGAFDLAEFVRTANELLSHYLPEVETPSEGSSRFKEQLNERLVRHYATLGLLDAPEKAGRENRYTYTHLVQLLALRKLQAEGHNTRTIEGLLQGRSDAELTALLEGGTRMEVMTGNPALAYLTQLKDSSLLSQTMGTVTLGIAPKRSASPSLFEAPDHSSTSRSRSRRWIRSEVDDGLEFFVREDYRPPKSRSEKQALLERITALIEEPSRKKKT